jgi:hypothetical protein
MPSSTIHKHFKQLSIDDPVSVTTRSDVPETTTAEGDLGSSLSFGDNLTDDTPDASSICLMLVPPFPIIIPQHEFGTSSRTTKSNPGLSAGTASD